MACMIVYVWWGSDGRGVKLPIGSYFSILSENRCLRDFGGAGGGGGEGNGWIWGRKNVWPVGAGVE